MEVEFGAMLAPVVDLIFAAVAVVVGWAVKKGTDALGIEKASKQVNEVVAEGVSWAKKQAQKKAKSTDISIENETIAQATRFVVNNAPMAMKAAGLDEKMVREKVESWL